MAVVGQAAGFVCEVVLDLLPGVLSEFSGRVLSECGHGVVDFLSAGWSMSVDGVLKLVDGSVPIVNLTESMPESVLAKLAMLPRLSFFVVQEFQCDVGDNQCGDGGVFVSAVGPDLVPDRFFATEEEPTGSSRFDFSGDVLEPHQQVIDDLNVVFFAEDSDERRGDECGEHIVIGSVLSVAEQVIEQDGCQLVSGQDVPMSGVIGGSDGESIGVWVGGHHEGQSIFLGRLDCRPEDLMSLGVGQLI